MATFEGMGFCTRQEYDTAFGSRLQYADLTRDDLYVARFELDKTDKCFRILGRIGLMDTNAGTADSGSVQIDFVNDMLRSVLVEPTSGTMSDGIWKPSAPIHVKATKGGTRFEPSVRSAFLSGYEGNVGKDFETFLALESDTVLIQS